MASTSGGLSSWVWVLQDVVRSLRFDHRCGVCRGVVYRGETARYLVFVTREDREFIAQYECVPSCRVRMM